MSGTIIDAIVSYSAEKSRPLMLIASRNQIDRDSGYVMTTEQFARRVNPVKSQYTKICRDHCGPYFLDSEKSLDLNSAVEATKKTIAADIENGFDLIHIDTSRCQNTYRVAEKLIDFCLKLNPNIAFEFGTEENIGIETSISKYSDSIKFAKQFPNMQFVVAQTGSLVMEDRQVGEVKFDVVEQLVAIANQAGIRLKEHNADYLTAEQVQSRSRVGVHALNIAPQLGVIETKTVLNLANEFDIDTADYSNTVLASNKWRKWHINGDDAAKVFMAGHYCFHSNAFFQLCELIDQHRSVKQTVTEEIHKVLDLYYENLI
jgi:hypothetical protein